MRVVVDTNVWVSALLQPAGLPARVLASHESGRFQHVTSAGLLDELAEVLARPRLVRRHRRSSEQIRLFVTNLGASSELVPLQHEVHVCRDPDDDLLLETAVRGQAVYLVSGDLDTLAEEVRLFLAGHAIRVLTVREFLQELESEASLPTSETPTP